MNNIKEYQSEYDEIDITRYIKVIFKRKLLILGVTILTTVLVGVFTSKMQKVYKIDTVLEIGTNEKNQQVEDPARLMGKINSDFYGTAIREKLGISREGFPKVKSANESGTRLIFLTIESSDIQKAKNVLEEMNALILNDYLKKTETQIEDNIKINIKITEGKIKFLESNIGSTKDKMNLIDNDIERLERGINYLEEDKDILKERLKVLERDGMFQDLEGPPTGSLFLFLNTAERLDEKIQEVESSYLDINSLKRARTDLNIQIMTFQFNMENLNSEIESFKSSLNNIQPSKIIKNPTVSKNPVKPKPFLNITIAIVLGFLIGLFLAFGKEWWEMNKNKI